MRRPEQRHGPSGSTFDRLAPPAEICQCRMGTHLCGQVGVRMRTQLMPLIQDSAHQRGMSFRVLPDAEEVRPDTELAEARQHPGSAIRVWSVIERKDD